MEVVGASRGPRRGEGHGVGISGSLDGFPDIRRLGFFSTVSSEVPTLSLPRPPTSGGRFRLPEALNGPRERRKTVQDEKPALGKGSGLPGTAF